MKYFPLKQFALLIAVTFTLSLNVQSQVKKSPDSLVRIYRETPVKINALIHTKLDVRFDYAKCYLYGKAWLTLKPYFYSTDSLRLDAKGMDIKQVSMVEGNVLKPLKYTYDSLQLNIKLGRIYSRTEKYTLFIDYVSKPNDLKTIGSSAITDAKGLYFINPANEDKDKPVQIWTQGETEASSVWFPTIDHSNQKTTSEIAMTVLSKYETLSNGKLVSRKMNVDGTRTDTWKMDLPHSPYLFMMAVGDFKIFKDKWRDKEVNYYLEPAFAPYAKQIFGHTPEMMEFFSKKLGVDFPWNKYSQIVVRDFVSGAMENTTATLHGEFVQATDRELLDENKGEDVISHELFHQWFGDYVTTESWSNLTVNESFANFSEVLWREYKYGKDEGDAGNYKDMQEYLGSPKDASKDLVRFHYADKEDMFDLVSYQKGGRVLYMLRNYLGEEAFFKGLNTYLKQNAFKNGEAHQLRLALEEASGKDLNWFFNQWYFGSGHPELNISYQWDEVSKTQKVFLTQLQDGAAFILPMAVDVYAGGKKVRHDFLMKDKMDTLSFGVDVRPDLVNVDADKVLLAKKEDHKVLSDYVFQYAHAPLYVDRLEAIDSCSANQTKNEDARKVMLTALKDPYYGLRILAINTIDLTDSLVRVAALPVLKTLSVSDPRTLVRAAALQSLASMRDVTNRPLFDSALKSESYSVQGAALAGVIMLDPKEAFAIAKTLQKDSKGDLTKAILAAYTYGGTEKELPFFNDSYEKAGLQDKVEMISPYLSILARIDNSEEVNKRVADFKEVGIKNKKYDIDKYVLNLFKSFKEIKTEMVKQASPEVKVELQKQLAALTQAMAELKGS
ncbi:aminopeptidase [Arcticibacter svalbardensis MN12-7]|uniref:Aminopeptidase N n=1 Tax=Arcticibacter svalbardensis MN12-7 TaxID=1150600 RepID=R9H0V7_9SPHI|nr:M1 family metallopeptidase [Arcticibacter svalbardensis]EOR94869.1 aminopeptidase [Arcticibacter svalbardensis MN12-7]